MFFIYQNICASIADVRTIDFIRKMLMQIIIIKRRKYRFTAISEFRSSASLNCEYNLSTMFISYRFVSVCGVCVCMRRHSEGVSIKMCIDDMYMSAIVLLYL